VVVYGGTRKRPVPRTVRLSESEASGPRFRDISYATANVKCSDSASSVVHLFGELDLTPVLAGVDDGVLDAPGDGNGDVSATRKTAGVDGTGEIDVLVASQKAADRFA